MLSFLNKAAIKMSVERIAQKAASQEAFSSGVGTAFPDHSVTQLYFQKYGTTEKKFQFYPQKALYVGFVQINGSPEFLSTVVMTQKGSVVASFALERSYGNSFIDLMEKKEFAERVAEGFLRS